MINTIITGTGHYLPDHVVTQEAFLKNEFYNIEKAKIEKDNLAIVKKLSEITGIRERRYAAPKQNTSDLAFFAAEKAIQSANIDPETLDYIIVAHNFGDVIAGSNRADFMPSLASRVKHKLQIKNPDCVCYDVAFGCPGWVQGIIQAHYYLKTGEAKKVMVIGAETLSRIVDPHDMDSMIYADGAGATILEGKEEATPRGILSHASRTDTFEEAYYLWMGKSYNPAACQDNLYIKMHGRKLYKYAVKNVPSLVKKCLDKGGLDVRDVNKVLIHQANEKLDEGIIRSFFRLYGIKEVPDTVMPMCIERMGNNSVATVPILHDLILNGEVEGHTIEAGNHLVFASVGAGMNVSAVLYKV
ncbi:MAG: 3-oxoacyl-ACP synthase III family protein [Saprospiraceae bacterium]